MTKSLRRKLGLVGLTASGVGMILGAGIYALIGTAARLAGNMIWVSFLIGAFISSFTGLSYAELSSMIPTSAAEVSYLREAFKSNLAPFLIGWIIIFTETVSASTVALGFSGYFKGLFATPVILTSIVLIILLSILNLFGIEESSRLNVIFTLIEAAGLIIVVIVGLPYLGRVNYVETAQGLQGVLRASTLIFFAYLGFQDIVNLAEESKSPEKDIPRALVLSVIITAIFYVFVSIAIVSLVDWRELGVSGSPLADAVSFALGQQSSLIMSAIALFATSNTVLILLVVISRMIYGMAKSGYLPMDLSKISSRGSPWVAVLVGMVLSSGFVLLGNIEFVAEITNFGTFVTFAFVNLSAILLKIRKPELNRPFQTPMVFGKLPIIPILGLLSCGLMAIQFRLEIIALSMLVIILGVLTYKILEKIDANEN